MQTHKTLATLIKNKSIINIIKFQYAGIFLVLIFLTVGCGGKTGDTVKDTVDDAGHSVYLSVNHPSQLKQNKNLNGSVLTLQESASIAIGGSQQFSATVTYADGSKQDVTSLAVWSSDSELIATVSKNSGLALGVDAGSSVISASFDGVTGSENLKVK